jgi:hypothetical protein
LFPEVATKLVAAAEADLAAAVAVAEASHALDTVLVSFGAGPLGLRFKGVAVAAGAVGGGGGSPTLRSPAASSRGTADAAADAKASPSQLAASGGSARKRRPPPPPPADRAAAVAFAGDAMDGLGRHAHRRSSGLGGGVGLPDDDDDDGTRRAHGGGGLRHLGGLGRHLSAHVPGRGSYGGPGGDGSGAAHMVIVGFAAVGEGPGPPEASGRVFLGDLLVEIRPFGASADDPDTVTPHPLTLAAHHNLF